MLNPAMTTEIPASQNDLGAPVRDFPVRKLNKTGSVAAFILLLLGGTAALAYGLVSASSAYWLHGAAVIWGKLGAPLLIAVSLFILALLAGISAYTHWPRGVLLYEHGFSIRSRKQTQDWRWEDIASIQINLVRHHILGLYTGTSHEYTLLNRQSERLILNDAFVQVEELAEAIQEKLLPLLYGSAARQYNEGEPLTFGPVVISQAGVQVGKQIIPWEEVKDISLQHGDLMVQRKDGRGTGAPASVIPNLRVLLSLLQQVVGLKTD